ncbi:MAG TPA: hypothetical protein DD979_02765 [Gammaproteobacteria bacterium]|nr:hypothetical protein [Gammaproteobacteria bacterium]
MCPPRQSRWPWRWLTSSICSPGSGPSTRSPPAPRIPSPLRRAALGVIRLVLENGLKLELVQGLLAPIRANRAAMVAVAPEGSAVPDLSDERVEAECALVLAEDLLAFFHGRLKVFLRDQGLRHDVIDACIARPGSDDLNRLVKRARALQKVLGTEDGENLVQGFKRANNILSQAEAKDGVEYSFGADAKYAEAESEKALFAALEAAEPRIKTALEAEDFTAAMSETAGLRAPIDAFFEEVQVNAENDVLRRNRLNLLSEIRRVCTQVADLARLDG